MKNPLHSRSLFEKLLLSLIPTTVLIIVCYFWIDPTFAFWVDHENLKRFSIFNYGTYLASGIIAWVFFYYCYFAWAFLHTCAGKKKRHPEMKWPLLNVANSVAISIFMKDALKIIFGRYWPNTWTNNNPSLIHDHAYGFHWFHQGPIYQSFPSGHTTVAIAFMVALWISLPRSPWRWLGVFVSIVIVAGLLANNYHFIGDCLAGGWVGAIVACYTTAVRKESINRGLANS